MFLFQLNTKRAPAVSLLTLVTLIELPTKRYDEHPILFIWESLPRKGSGVPTFQLTQTCDQTTKSASVVSSLIGLQCQNTVKAAKSSGIIFP